MSTAYKKSYLHNFTLNYENKDLKKQNEMKTKQKLSVKRLSEYFIRADLI